MATNLTQSAAPSPPVPDPERDKGTELRYAFVEMLFALAVGEVAVVASHIVQSRDLNYPRIPAVAHLVLATILIATSWVGWSSSRWRKRVNRIETPFSVDFLGLLLDVLLVIFYFILVRQAEVSEDAPYSLEKPSAAEEAVWIVWIFSVYAVWDFVSDFLDEPKKDTLRGGALLILSSIACSVTCAALADLILVRAHQANTPNDVILLDAALIALLLLFRVAKPPVENWMAKHLSALRRYQAFETQHQLATRQGLWILIVSAIYVGALAATYVV